MQMTNVSRYAIFNIPYRSFVYFLDYQGTFGYILNY